MKASLLNSLSNRSWLSHTKVLLILLALLILLLPLRTQAQEQPSPPRPDNAQFVPPSTSELWTAVDYTEDGWPIVADELIVKFKDNVPEGERETTISEKGAQTKHISQFDGARLIKVDAAERENLLEQLSSDANIEVVDRNHIAQADAAPPRLEP